MCFSWYGTFKTALAQARVHLWLHHTRICVSCRHMHAHTQTQTYTHTDFCRFMQTCIHIPMCYCAKGCLLHAKFISVWMTLCTYKCISVRSDLVLTSSTDGFAHTHTHTHTHTITCSMETKVLGATPRGHMGESLKYRSEGWISDSHLQIFWWKV